VTLGSNETGLLEDCSEDWRGLWEILWAVPEESMERRIAFLSPLVEGGYLTTLRLTDWNQARSAVPMPISEAFTVVGDPASYVPPAHPGSPFYVLSITPKGEGAINPAAFPRLQKP
jgi:hypothetical protein